MPSFTQHDGSAFEGSVGEAPMQGLLKHDVDWSGKRGVSCYLIIAPSTIPADYGMYCEGSMPLAVCASEQRILSCIMTDASLGC